MKTNYSTLILRYVHDVVTGEFANIGVVLYAPDQRFLEARFATSYERLNAIFLKIDHLHFRALMRYMTNRFEELGAEIENSAGNRVKIKLSNHSAAFTHAQHSLPKEEVIELRKFLEQCGVTPDKYQL